MDNQNKVPNRLIQEKSPYLLQHAYNPVDWYPWCEEAFIRAKRENKPVFLSIGYSSCHWCHVMEEESFDNQEVADALNKSFIAIKVDKEERPDIDAVYMAVCQAFTGQGGWPTTLLLTPEQKPFFAGTYFPREQQHGRSGLLELLEAAREAWSNNPARLEKTGDQVIAMLSGEDAKRGKASLGEWRESGPLLVEQAGEHFAETFDPAWGGFGSAPKFPTPHNLLLLLQMHERKQPEKSPEARYGNRKRKPYVQTKALEMVEKTLQQMYAGGLYDHIGYGFCRYSTDEKWLVPHFEKMLYDNALLVMAYAECWRITGKPFYRRAAEEILDYVTREMRSPEGGFYSAQDADSEGGEGLYYLLTPQEVASVLGDAQGEWFCGIYGIKEGGNFEGKSIPNLISLLKHEPESFRGLEQETEFNSEETPEDKEKRHAVGQMKKALRRYRKQRMGLHTDDKVLTSWNSLMIAAFAKAYQIFGKKEYLVIAEEAEQFLRDKLVKKDGGLYVRYRDGQSAGDGYLDDYAFYEWALLELLCASHKACYLQRAMEIQDKMIKDFCDEENGGFYFIGNDQEQLIFRPKESYDGAIPSGNAAAAHAMIKLCEKLGGSEERKHHIEEQLSFLTDAAKRYPAGYALGLSAVLKWNSRVNQ